MKSVASPMPSTADQNREKLQTWSNQAEYKSISFWVPPHIVSTPEECIAEVAEGMTRIEEDLKNGHLHPVGDGDISL